MEEISVDKVKKEYKDEWVIVEVLEEDELGRPLKVRVIAHSRNRDDIYEELGKIENKKHVATFYTGKIPEKGYAVAFVLWEK